MSSSGLFSVKDYPSREAQWVAAVKWWAKRKAAK